MRPLEYFKNEAHFQKWVIGEMHNFGCHIQPIEGSSRYLGLPDLSIGMDKLDVWAEVKMYHGEYGVYDQLFKITTNPDERALTAQQKNWLVKRAERGGSMCGVLFAWRTNCGDYVTFLPINKWGEAQTMSLAALVLSPFTETLNRIVSGRVTLPQFIHSVHNLKGL